MPNNVAEEPTIPADAAVAAAAESAVDDTLTSPAGGGGGLSSSVAKRYNSILRDFMSYCFDNQYKEDHVFTEEELFQIMPEHLIRYFKFKLYGDGDVEPTTTPTYGSHHTVDYHKKAISSFMGSRKDQPWDNLTKTGNPTRAKSVKNFSRNIREFEKDAGGSKKRKDNGTPVPSSSPKKPRAVELPAPATTAVDTSASPNPVAIVSGILQKVEQQNAMAIDILGTIGTSIESFKNQLQANNQAITAEIQRLNTTLQQPPVLYAPVAAPAAAAVATAASSVTIPALPLTASSLPNPSVGGTCWFYDHPDGSKRRVPPSWKFPSGTLLELYTLWHLGDPLNCISPMKTFVSGDVACSGKRSRMCLSEARLLVAALDKEVGKAGISITANTTQAELVEIFRLAVSKLNMPLSTPTGRQRDIYRLKWSTFTKHKLTPKDEQEDEEVTDLTVPIEQDGSNWLYEHGDGSRRKVPSTWRFPMVGLQDMFIMWHCKDEVEKIMPMKTFTSMDVSFLDKGSKNLSEVRGMMNIISEQATTKGIEIKEVMTIEEATSAFSAGVEALNIPLFTPQGKARNISRTKWSSASRYKNKATDVESENV